MGILPNLVELDLTKNALNNLTSFQLAAFCRLKLLHLDEDVFAESFCDCVQLENYAREKSIVVKGLECKPLDGE